MQSVCHAMKEANRDCDVHTKNFSINELTWEHLGDNSELEIMRYDEKAENQHNN